MDCQRKGDFLESLPEETDRTFIRTDVRVDARMTAFGSR